MVKGLLLGRGRRRPSPVSSASEPRFQLFSLLVPLLRILELVLPGLWELQQVLHPSGCGVEAGGASVIRSLSQWAPCPFTVISLVLSEPPRWLGVVCFLFPSSPFCPGPREEAPSCDFPLGACHRLESSACTLTRPVSLCHMQQEVPAQDGLSFLLG